MPDIAGRRAASVLAAVFCSLAAAGCLSALPSEEVSPAARDAEGRDPGTGDDASAKAGSCGTLTLSAAPSEPRAGEVATVTASVLNCGDRAWRLERPAACTDLALALALEHEGRSYVLLGSGPAYPEGWDCAAAEARPDLMVLPGERVEGEVSWNGTICIPSPDRGDACSPVPAPEGPYVLRGSVFSHEAGLLSDTTIVEVVG